MGMSRRKFTREFKEAAVRRLELGASITEVARACEVNPNIRIAGGVSPCNPQVWLKVVQRPFAVWRNGSSAPLQLNLVAGQHE